MINMTVMNIFGKNIHHRRNNIWAPSVRMVQVFDYRPEFKNWLERLNVCISYPWWRQRKFVLGYWTWLGLTSIQQDSSKPLSRLQKFTVMFVDSSDRRGLSLNNSGHCHQRFERALSWDKVTQCNFSRQKFNTALDRFVWFYISSHVSLSEYRNNNIYIFRVVVVDVFLRPHTRARNTWIKIARKIKIFIRAKNVINEKRHRIILYILFRIYKHYNRILLQAKRFSDFEFFVYIYFYCVFIDCICRDCSIKRKGQGTWWSNNEAAICQVFLTYCSNGSNTVFVWN